MLWARSGRHGGRPKTEEKSGPYHADWLRASRALFLFCVFIFRAGAFCEASQALKPAKRPPLSRPPKMLRDRGRAMRFRCSAFGRVFFSALLGAPNRQKPRRRAPQKGALLPAPPRRFIKRRPIESAGDSLITKPNRLARCELFQAKKLSIGFKTAGRFWRDMSRKLPG